MNQQVIDLLRKTDVLEECITGMRGPDSERWEGQKYKSALTAVLRWAGGFAYGEQGTPRELTYALFLDRDNTAYQEARAIVGPHFLAHCNIAYDALQKVGWTLSRIPLVAYFDQRKAWQCGREILFHAGCHLEGRDGAETLTRLLRESSELPDDDHKLVWPECPVFGEV